MTTTYNNAWKTYVNLVSECCWQGGDVDGGHLELSNIQKENAGEYTCTASNGAGNPVSRSIQIHVNCTYQWFLVGGLGCSLSREVFWAPLCDRMYKHAQSQPKIIFGVNNYAIYSVSG